MGFFLIVICVVGFVLLVWFVGTYNAMVRLRNHCREAWSDIDTELKRRYDLIPNLVETVKAYAAHERRTLEAVIKARRQAVNSTGSPGAQAADENSLVHTLRSLLAVVEKYPDLKANENFLALQGELVNTEDRIQAARRFFNGNVRDLNNRIEVIPSNIVASLCGFQKEEYFEIESAVQRQAPRVDLS